MSQTKAKGLPVFDVVEFFEGARTERGEKVYSHMTVEFHPFASSPVKRILTCDKGIGVTEEWIEETIEGCLKALERDYPDDIYKVTRLEPNYILFEYSGSKGPIN